jgi:cob(I)alamin adenosyltransferase
VLEPLETSSDDSICSKKKEEQEQQADHQQIQDVEKAVDSVAHGLVPLHDFIFPEVFLIRKTTFS